MLVSSRTMNQMMLGLKRKINVFSSSCYYNINVQLRGECMKSAQVFYVFFWDYPKFLNLKWAQIKK